MARMTIDYGIDLGTTNSEIALLKGTEVEVFRNNLNQEYTPSVVWLDKEGRVVVGQRAKAQLELDEENARGEFKLQMGSDTEYVFTRSGRRLRPEDLSAEVLKSLKADARRKTGEEVEAAVICIPAAFEAQQCQATERAAKAAGLRASPLLQEPIAAALAYGFQSTEKKAFWLVYDLGGGTFDAAVVSLIDGELSVVNHGGDNHLGGKLFDWDLVEQVLVPAVLRAQPLPDFRRGVRRWAGAFAKLKQQAETAKIVLSTDEACDVVVDSLGKDDRGGDVRLECTVTRADVERVMEPYVTRSLNICRRVLEQRRLGTGDVQRVLLVGGPTLSPYLRERLSDPRTGLGIPLEFGVDPMTVVARGAAVFAGSQKMPAAGVGYVGSAPAAAGGATLELEYKPIGSDAEPMVGGRVRVPGRADLSGCTIEFVNVVVRPEWRSGRLALDRDGTFMTQLYAERGPRNEFRVELRTEAGAELAVTPSRVPYTIGSVIGSAVHVHNVGIALANNEVRWLFQKGQPLQGKARTTVRSVVPVRKGSSADAIKVPVVEGEHSRADRNSPIGFLVVRGDQIARDLPAGSEVELELEFDESRILRVRAYVPLVDQDFDHVDNLAKTLRSASDLATEAAEVGRRLAEVRTRASQTPDERASRALRRIDEERMQDNVASALAAAGGDKDAADKCQKRLQEFRAALDEVDDALEWPALVAEAEKSIATVAGFFDEPAVKATPEERATLASLRRDLAGATRARDAELVRKVDRDASKLGASMLSRTPAFWLQWLEHLEGQRSTMTDRAKADAYAQQARRAVNANDVDGLRAAVLQLAALLPADQREELRSKLGSTVQ